MENRNCTVFALALALAAPAPAQSGRPQKLASPNAVPEGLSAPDWSSIRQQYEQQRHAAFPVDGGYQARNPGQQWQTRFDGRGFLTQPDAAGWQWGLELRSYGFAGHERVVAGSPRVSATSQRVTYDWDATLQEWFVNDRHGLEHGFTVRERPPQIRRAELHEALTSDGDSRSSSLPSSAPLNFLLAVRGGLRPEVQADGRGVRFVDAHGAAALTYAGLMVRDADGRTLPARFEPVEESLLDSLHDFEIAQRNLEPARGVTQASSPASSPGVPPGVRTGSETLPQLAAGTDCATRFTESLRIVIDERGARYPLTIDPIAQQAYLKASNTGVFDQFGTSVAVSGDTVVVGAWQESSSATGVDGDQSDNSANQSGAAYVFARSGTTWSQQAYLKASNTDARDSFGVSVAVSGDTVVVGAEWEDSNATGVDGNQSDNSTLQSQSGAAYIFTGLGIGRIGPTLALAPDGSGGYFLSLNGIPDLTYRLQRAPSVTGPWSTLVTNTAPASGLIEYHETSPRPGAAFYRTAQP